MTAVSTDTDTLTNALSPILQARGLDLVDVELQGAQLTVFVDREGGINLDELGDATRDVSAALDEIDPIPGRCTLSVSSPGLERRLRTPAHFARFVGDRIWMELKVPRDGRRRYTGQLVASDGTAVELNVDGAMVRVPFDEISRARLAPA